MFMTKAGEPHWFACFVCIYISYLNNLLRAPPAFCDFLPHRLGLFLQQYLQLKSRKQ